MNEASNKTVMGILVVTMLVSLGGTFMTLTKMSKISPGPVVFTGMATLDTGTAAITISNNLEIVVDNSSVDFGACVFDTNGAVNANISSEMTGTEINATDINCTAPDFPMGFVVRNNGNVFANVTITTSGIASDIFEGYTTSDPAFYYKATENKEDACDQAGDLQSTYNSFAAAATKYKLCDNLTYVDTADEIEVWMNFTVPKDARTSASNTPTITFTGHYTV